MKNWIEKKDSKIGKTMNKLKNNKIITKFLYALSLMMANFMQAGELTQPGALNQGGEFRPYRPAIVLMGGLKAAIAALDSEINNLESEAVGVPSLKQDLAAAKAQLAQAKNNLGITPLEAQQNALKQQFDGFAQRFFKDTQIEDTFLYYSLNDKITSILNDPEINRKLQDIVRLKREIGERITNAIKDINGVGAQINLMTRSDQRGLNGIKTQLAFIQQQLSVKLLSETAQAQLNPIEQKISAIQTKIDQQLALHFTDDRLNLIRQYKNRMRVYELLLDYLRDPSLIPLITEDKIIGVE